MKPHVSKTEGLNGKNTPLPVMNRMIVNSSYAFYTALGKLPG